jgi:hypothetical protein
MTGIVIKFSYRNDSIHKVSQDSMIEKDSFRIHTEKEQEKRKHKAKAHTPKNIRKGTPPG